MSAFGQRIDLIDGLYLAAHGNAAPCAQRTVVFSFGDAIKPVRGEFQALSIEKENFATAGADQASALQIVHGIGEARPSHPEQQGEEFMGDGDGFGADAVVPHQQPAREPLVELRLDPFWRPIGSSHDTTAAH